MTKTRKRTIWVTARRHGRRLSRLKIVYPQWMIDRAQRPVYDAPAHRR